MTSTLRRALLMLAGVVVAGTLATPTLAHHAFTAEFDSEQGLTITGTITGVDWINPHVQLYVDVKDTDGNVIHWTLEGPPTAHWHVDGLKKVMLPEGQVIKLLCYRAKDGTKNLAWIRKITFIGGPHDGESHEMWFGGLDKNGNPVSH